MPAHEGPSYLPHSWQEATLWLTMVLAGAFVGRSVMVFAYHHSKRWD